MIMYLTNIMSYQYVYQIFEDNIILALSFKLKTMNNRNKKYRFI